MSITSKYIALKNYIPTGNPSINDFSIKTEEIKLKNKEQLLVKNEWISVDPYMRARMTTRKNYIPFFELGKAMEGAAVSYTHLTLPTILLV